VRIDEVDGEVPGLAGRAQLFALGSEPAGAESGSRFVEIIAAERAVVDVADAKEILESIGLDDLAVGRERRIDCVFDLVEVDAEVPLALVRRVIAEFGEAMADGLHGGRHVALPQRVGIVEDAGTLDVLTGIDRRTRRRADARGALVVLEGDAVRLDPFAGRHREGPLLEEVFLIDQDEQDVVAARRHIGCHDLAGGRRRGGRGHRRCHGLRLRNLRQDVGAQQGGAAGEHGSPGAAGRLVLMVHPWSPIAKRAESALCGQVCRMLLGIRQLNDRRVRVDTILVVRSRDHEIHLRRRGKTSHQGRTVSRDTAVTMGNATGRHDHIVFFGVERSFRSRRS